MAKLRLKILRPKPLRIDRMAETMDRVIAGRVGEQIKKDFDSTTSTWVDRAENNKPLGGRPQFRIAKLQVGRYEIATEHAVYYYVNFGTSAHPITPRRRGGRLKFRANYRAKTYPRRLSSSAGGKFGPWIFRRAVMHKGSRAREFDTAVVEKNGLTMRLAIEEALSIEAGRIRS
jgi:hypothetical protein